VEQPVKGESQNWAEAEAKTAMRMKVFIDYRRNEIKVSAGNMSEKELLTSFGGR
jgi:hypothetical protein